MNNYEWQKQYTRQQIASRLHEAEVHRLLANRPALPRPNPLTAFLRAFRGLLPARRAAANATLFHSEQNA